MYRRDGSHVDIEALPDGFERWGPRDSPFLLRGGEDLRDTARAIHEDRPRVDQEEDEASNERITRELDDWQVDIWNFDFPFTDTIPEEELFKRAEKAASDGNAHGFISEIDLEASLNEPSLLGTFAGGSGTIKVSALDSGFLRTTRAVILAHEVGHAYHNGIARLNRKAGYDDDEPAFFETERQREAAIAISERLRGPIPESPPETRHYRLNDTELVADVFASFILEPEAARRVGSQAVDRLEAFLGPRRPDIA